MAVKERVYRMNLADFHRYLEDKREELQACYKETEEVQFQFNDLFKKELQAWQDLFSFCYPRVTAQRRDLPPEFAQRIDQAEAEEHAALEKEISDLEKWLTQARERMDQLIAQAQLAGKTLQETNPELNETEERLKSEMMRHEDAYVRAYEEIEKLDTFPFGWLVNGGKLRDLRKKQRDAKRKQANILGRLRKVRQEWQDKMTETADAQAKLRQEWEELGIKVSEAQSRHDQLQANLDALAEQHAVQGVLEKLDAPPSVGGELGEKLGQLVEHNRVRRDYEEGLRAVAEALGLTKGVGEGLERFQKSVGTVLEEQRRFNLKQVEVPLSQSVVDLNEIWKTLRNQVRDEKYLGTHPLEFSRIVERSIKERLTDDSIQGLFEKMGKALNVATAAWK